MSCSCTIQRFKQGPFVCNAALKYDKLFNINCLTLTAVMQKRENVLKLQQTECRACCSHEAWQYCYTFLNTSCISAGHHITHIKPYAWGCHAVLQGILTIPELYAQTWKGGHSWSATDHEAACWSKVPSSAGLTSPSCRSQCSGRPQAHGYLFLGV